MTRFKTGALVAIPGHAEPATLVRYSGEIAVVCIDDEIIGVPAQGVVLYRSATPIRSQLEGEPDFKPDWASPPGDTIRELLNESKLPMGWLAGASGISQHDVAGLLLGMEPLTNTHAHRLAETIGPNAAFWVKREAQYRARLSEQEQPNTTTICRGARSIPKIPDSPDTRHAALGKSHDAASASTMGAAIAEDAAKALSFRGARKRLRERVARVRRALRVLRGGC